MRKQAIVLGFGACVLMVSAWFFADGAGLVIMGAGMMFGWMVRHISPRGRPAAFVAAPESDSMEPDDAAARLQSLEARTSSLRHDLRGILSPAYLTAERLLNHADPAAKRAGEMMIKTVERASARLNETKTQ